MNKYHFLIRFSGASKLVAVFVLDESQERAEAFLREKMPGCEVQAVSEVEFEGAGKGAER